MMIGFLNGLFDQILYYIQFFLQKTGQGNNTVTYENCLFYIKIFYAQEYTCLCEESGKEGKSTKNRVLKSLKM